MKRLYFIILITICGLTAMAQDRPDMTHQSTGRDRMGYKFDKPTLVFDNALNQIAVYGCASEYYDVTITSQLSQQVIYMTVINGIYDIIDTSIMPSGAYIITLTSQRGNIYKWTFDQGLQDNLLPGTYNFVDQFLNWGTDFDHLTY